MSAIKQKMFWPYGLRFFLYLWIKVIVLQMKKKCFSECSEVSNWQWFVQKAWRCPLWYYPLWMHWGSYLSCWGNLKKQLQFGKRGSYATYLHGRAQVKEGSRHLVFYWVFFLHLLIIFVIVQSYSFSHFLTILNKSYNWNCH